jgi:prepilin-type N-terminal cleavage/methylation domain-containing protein
MNKAKKGFTLIELLVSLGIFAIIMVVGSTMFFSILKSASKSQAIQQVKQNGDYAISVMGQMIRNAVSLVECDPQHNYITIQNPGAQIGETTFRFCQEEQLIASMSGELNCRQGRLTSERVRLISGSFTCDPFWRPNTVDIEFTLGQTGLTVRPEEEAQVSFKTTITLRNPAVPRIGPD